MSTEDFERVFANGFQAHLKSYAYLPVMNPAKESMTNILYYLDVVGPDEESVKAILASVIKEPATDPLHFERKDKHRETFWMAAKEQIGARKMILINLSYSAGKQGVLVGEKAMPGFISPEEAKKETARAGENPTRPDSYFVILLLDELPESHYPVESLYLSRLNKEVETPLLKEWRDWLWDYSVKNKYTKQLITKGCRAWFCQVPKEKVLEAAIGEALRKGEIFNGPEIVEGEAFDPKQLDLLIGSITGETVEGEIVIPEEDKNDIIDLEKVAMHDAMAMFLGG